MITQLGYYSYAIYVRESHLFGTYKSVTVKGKNPTARKFAKT